MHFCIFFISVEIFFSFRVYDTSRRCLIFPASTVNRRDLCAMKKSIKTRSVTHTLVHIHEYFTLDGGVIQYSVTSWCNNPFYKLMFDILGSLTINLLVQLIKSLRERKILFYVNSIESFA